MNEKGSWCPLIKETCVGEKCVAFQDWFHNRFGYCRMFEDYIEAFGMRYIDDKTKEGE